MRQETKQSQHQFVFQPQADPLSDRHERHRAGKSSTRTNRHITLRNMSLHINIEQISHCPPGLSPPRLPLSMLRHVDGPPGRYRGATVCHTEDLHGLPLRSPLAVTVQHGGVHPLLWGICGKKKKTRPTTRIKVNTGVGVKPIPLTF